MSGSRGSGFTVIEVMLFLAISGFLVIGVMGGAGAAVNVQRYKDATNSFVSYMQGQYDRVANVQNDHNTKQECTSAGIAVATTPPVTLGASIDCAVIGRLVTVSDGGKKITSQAVYGAAATNGTDDITALVSANIFIDAAVDVEDSYVPEWSTRIVKPTPDQATTMDGWRLLIVRSPATGTIRTFTTMQSEATVPLQSIATTAATRADVTACVDPSGLIAGSSQGVKIVKDAPGMSGVKLTTQGEC